jgi:hypothetical protein
MTVGCCSLVDHQQTQAYHRNLNCNPIITYKDCCSCDIPAGWPCTTGPFTTPAADYLACTTPAGAGTCPWWYDPLIPESGEIAGMWLVGFDEDAWRSTLTTTTEPTVAGGLAFGPTRESGRCITVTAWIDALSCRASRYMVQALQARLESDCGESLYVFDSCPPPATPPAQAGRFLLEIPGIELTESVRVLERRGQCCSNQCSGSAVKVQWTWCAPHTDIYIGTETVCDQAIPVNVCTPGCDMGYWYGLLQGGSTACDCPPPTTTPLPTGCCDPQPLAPALPTVATTCWLPPLGFHVLPCDVMSQFKWFPASVSVEINAGTTPLGPVRVVAFPKRFEGETCATTQAEFIDRYRCETPILDIRVLGLPAYAQLVADPVTRDVVVRFAGETTFRPAWSLIDAIGVAPVTAALDLGVCAEACLYVLVDCSNTGGGSVVTRVRPRRTATF